MKRKSGLLLVISGPSGSGKTTLIKSLIKDKTLRSILAKSVSFTTRPKRKGEREGRDYFFISRRPFNRLVKAKKILERTKYLDYYYGTSRDYVDAQLNKGRSIVLCLDTEGAEAIKKIYPHQAVTVFILPPGMKVLRRRIRRRSEQTGEKNLSARLILAKKEIIKAKDYDYRIVNDNFQSASRMLKMIFRKEANL